MRPRLVTARQGLGPLGREDWGNGCGVGCGSRSHCGYGGVFFCGCGCGCGEGLEVGVGLGAAHDLEGVGWRRWGCKLIKYKLIK